jgi:protein translocase SecG subunit
MLSSILTPSVVSVLQIIVAVLLMGLILLQERGSESSGLFGGGDMGGGFYQRRRGFERFTFIATIVLVIAFAGLAVVNLFI